MSLSERDYYLGFAVFQKIGPLRFKLLVEYFGTARDAWNAGETDLESVNLGKKISGEFINFRRKFSFTSFLKNLEEKKIDFLTISDSEYPELLSEIYDPPIVLFIRGEAERLRTMKKLVAVVGTRKMTVYGREGCRKISKGLAEKGVTVVSGMAKGIDTVAHQTAIENKGMTVAVLGTGIDIVYPYSNYSLYFQIVKKNGLVVSEYPPGFAPTRTSFPLRNRIISGLSLGVVVIEGKRTSGAMITAKYALDQGREVFAVPGPINFPTSEGTAYLIKQGAMIASGAEDILEVIK